MHFRILLQSALVLPAFFILLAAICTTIDRCHLLTISSWSRPPSIQEMYMLGLLTLSLVL